jgi:hypothetical protein
VHTPVEPPEREKRGVTAHGIMCFVRGRGRVGRCRASRYETCIAQGAASCSITEESLSGLPSSWFLVESSCCRSCSPSSASTGRGKKRRPTCRSTTPRRRMMVQARVRVPPTTGRRPGWQPNGALRRAEQARPNRAERRPRAGAVAKRTCPAQKICVPLCRPRSADHGPSVGSPDLPKEERRPRRSSGRSCVRAALCPAATHQTTSKTATVSPAAMAMFDWPYTQAPASTTTRGRPATSDHDAHGT